jgi:hypothetical protein
VSKEALANVSLVNKEKVVIKVSEHDLGGCYVLTDTASRFNRLDLSYDELKQLAVNLTIFVEAIEQKRKRAALFKSYEDFYLDQQYAR